MMKKAMYVRKPWSYIEDIRNVDFDDDSDEMIIVVATELQPPPDSSWYYEGARSDHHRSVDSIEDVMLDADKLIWVPSVKYSGWHRTFHLPREVMEFWV